MKTQEELLELFCLDKHISCTTYKSSLNTGFRYAKFRKGQKICNKLMPRNNLIMLTSGTLKISRDTYSDHVLKEWRMILIPKSAKFSLTAMEDAEFMLFGFGLTTTGCDRNYLQSYNRLWDSIAYDFKSTEIKSQIKLFLNLLVSYLEGGISCPHMHEAKHKELFLCLKSFYSTDEVAYLMHPIIKGLEDFRNTILGNIDNFTCVNDMVELTNMSRARFFVKFKQEFGVTAKQWMLKHQIDKIRYAATTPNITVKELMIDHGFDNSSQFSQFCKLHFGCVPSYLIKSNQPDIQCNNDGEAIE